ncbi:MAG: restriction endonuclease [Treponema sp.]|jgi:tetratricopeptide (TPR) repeat protein|nr:restriction endonuclease [Treponema sp.]
MDTTLPIVVFLIVLVGVIIVIRILVVRRKNPGGKQIKDTELLLKQVNKRLAQNPRDPEALFTLANVYYNQESWDKAFKTYEILYELVGMYPEMDAFQIYVQYGFCALKIGCYEAAYRGFNEAWTLRQDSFEVNYNMGMLEFQQKNYEKTIQFLSLARKQNSEHAPTLRSLGHAFFKLMKYKEAMAFIRKSLELSPNDKESLFILGECYYEVGHVEQALRIFSHLRTDPERGPQSAFFAGTINMAQHKVELAVEDFEMGLKHKNIEPDISFELRYQLAVASLKLNEIGKAVTILKEIYAENAEYKDVASLINQYEELNTNKNLQIFMLASSTDFVALCRKIVFNYHSKSKTKIINVLYNKNEWIDIIAEVETVKWSDLIMFRFIRSQGSIGELIVRDLHSRLKEMKAGRGICITVGAFSEEARRFTEARLIDLLEKEQLVPLLSSIDTKVTASTSSRLTTLEDLGL